MEKMVAERWIKWRLLGLFDFRYEDLTVNEKTLRQTQMEC